MNSVSSGPRTMLTQNGLETGNAWPMFENGVDYNWHSKDKLNRQIRQFHERRARQPNSLKLARNFHAENIGKLYLKMKELEPKLFSGIIYTGSSYEGGKVGSLEDDDLEFDIMILLDPGPGEIILKQTDMPGFCEVYLSNPDQVPNFLQKSLRNGCVTPELFMGDFQRLIALCIRRIQAEAHAVSRAVNNIETNFLHENISPTTGTSSKEWFMNTSGINSYFKNMSCNTEVVRHGPAVQLDVYHPETDIKFYSVDIVPTLAIKGTIEKSLYVAKPCKSLSLNTWRQSFSLKEKDKFDGVDRDNSCRKQIYRIIKAIRNREVGLAKLSSYYIKTILFREMDFIPNNDQWKSECIGLRLMGVLRRIRDELSSGRIEHYYIPELNLLELSSGMNSTTITQMANRISRLVNSEKAMRHILYVPQSNPNLNQVNPFNPSPIKGKSKSHRMQYSRK